MNSYDGNFTVFNGNYKDLYWWGVGFWWWDVNTIKSYFYKPIQTTLCFFLMETITICIVCFSRMMTWCARFNWWAKFRSQWKWMYQIFRNLCKISFTSHSFRQDCNEITWRLVILLLVSLDRKTLLFKKWEISIHSSVNMLGYFNPLLGQNEQTQLLGWFKAENVYI